MMRVAHVNGRDVGGGTDVAAYELHRELIRQGVESQLIVGEKKSDDPLVTQIPSARGVPGLKRLTLKLERQFGFQYLYSPRFRLLQEAFSKSVDAVHLHSLHGVGGYADIGHLPWLAKRWPLVLTLHDMWMLTGHCGYGTGCDRWKIGCGHCPNLTLYPAISKDRTRWNWNRKKRVIQRCPEIQVTAPSAWLAGCAKESPMYDHVNIHVVPNAIDIKTFQIGDKIAARKRLNLPTDCFLILLCANSLTNIWKGIPDGLQALNGINRDQVEVLLVGQGGDEAKQKLKIPATILPYQSDRTILADVYRAANVLLMPSIEEAFGLVAAEAMACGTPVVAYASGGLPEVVTEGCGIVVPTHDISRLGFALTQMIDNLETSREMGLAAALSAAKRFSISDQAQTFLKIYQLAIEKHNTRWRKN